MLFKNEMEKKDICLRSVDLSGKDSDAVRSFFFPE
jgi:hypothetical protein